jgi:alanyl-tRNA synthetase
VLGTADGSRATVVAACTKALVDRGVTAPRLLEPAARILGGRAGGKPGLAFGGGGNPSVLDEALGSIRGHLTSLLDSGG